MLEGYESRCSIRKLNALNIKMDNQRKLYKDIGTELYYNKLIQKTKILKTNYE